MIALSYSSRQHYSEKIDRVKSLLAGHWSGPIMKLEQNYKLTSQESETTILAATYGADVEKLARC